MIKRSTPPALIGDEAALTWREVLYGVDNELLAQGAAVELAADEIATQDAPSPTLVELADIGQGEPTRHLVA